MRILFVAEKTNPTDRLKQVLVNRGYEVDYVSYRDIIRRLNYVSYQVYDLIMLHWVSLNGQALSLCRAIREHHEYMPIVVFSELFSDEEKKLALDAGADIYHGRPFPMEKLDKEITALTNKPALVRLAPKIEIGDLVLDTKQRKASIGARILQLTSKEFSLLEYLVRNMGTIVSRENIFDNVWEFGSNISSNVVDVHIKNIRKKIKSKKSMVIETVRSAGYRMIGRPKLPSGNNS